MDLTGWYGQPNVLINRFILNLRQLNETANHPSNSGHQHFSRFSAPSFRITQTGSGRLGNIGEPLEHGQIDDVVGNESQEVPGGNIQRTEGQDGGFSDYALRQINGHFVEGSSGIPWDAIEEVS